MNVFKKMIAFMSACAVLCGSAVMMNASATNNCDVNGDGEVSIADVLMINQYLLGNFSLSDPSVLDVNNNYVVDAVDAQNVLAVTVQGTFDWYFT